MTAMLDRALDALPHAYCGPGGAAAVLRRGELIDQRTWGWANAERRLAFTPRTLFRICSITKQFTSALLLDHLRDLDRLNADVTRHLPGLPGPTPTALHLCHNQSGLRDYWALAMLQGAEAESPFGAADWASLRAAPRSLQFPPGSSYAYSNGGFRLLADILEERAGEPFADLLARRLFLPAGMDGAQVIGDTRAMPGGAEGYEGSQAEGFRPARNNILWGGDAAVCATLEDMIAWERWIDVTREDPDSVYRRLSAPVAFADGAEAVYGFGLARGKAHGHAYTGHAGALRGWRSYRLYVPAARISVVVFFNHMADAQAAALELLGAALGAPAEQATDVLPPPDWLGAYLDPASGLSVRLDAAGRGVVRLRYGHSAERLRLRADGSADNGQTRVAAHGGELLLERPQERSWLTPQRLGGLARDDVSGRFRCAELDSRLTVEVRDGAAYGAFDGVLGTGRMELLTPLGPDVWLFPCPRALDHTPPGDWTLRFTRDEVGEVDGLTVGCWLARGLRYFRDCG